MLDLGQVLHKGTSGLLKEGGPLLSVTFIQIEFELRFEACRTVFSPTTPIALPRQDTRLTRPDPRPQVESTLHWGPVINRWSYVSLA